MEEEGDGGTLLKDDRLATEPGDPLPHGHTCTQDEEDEEDDMMEVEPQTQESQT